VFYFVIVSKFNLGITELPIHNTQWRTHPEDVGSGFLNHQYLFTTLYGVTSQKAVVSIICILHLIWLWCMNPEK